MAIFYSKTFGAFFHDTIHTAEQIPTDAIEISEEFHQALIIAQCHGKIITSDDKGYPILIEPPALTEDQIKQRANTEIIRQIETIERDRQPRAMREYLVEGNKTRLEELHTQIAELRAQLQ